MIVSFGGVCSNFETVMPIKAWTRERVSVDTARLG